ncbi:MAG: lytic transglycosylase domain-containing protein [Acetobacteraceae bacterium]|nr:lytic transglycosylase domain-containing protein [Acetobacteraceae bacterium]
MRAIGTTLARGLPAGLICGAALWASSGSQPAAAQGLETLELAAAPRAPANALPRPLAGVDAARYRRIFDAQDRGDFAAAERELRNLADPLLLGHVEADRLLSPRTRASAEELAAWFSRYADHPDAVRIHALLVARLPRGQAAPPAPTTPAELPAAIDAEAATPVDEALQAAARNGLERTVRDRARAGDARGALAAITAARPDAETAAMLRGEVAHALFLLNRDAEALTIARESGPQHFLPGFAGGLAAFRLDRPAEAMALFVRAHAAPGAQAAQKAAAAFWAARAALRARRPQHYAPWLAEAAQSPRSFYGLMARRVLGLSPGFAWERDRLGQADAALLAETGNGIRALALLQVGQKDRAAAEMRLLAPRAQDNPALARALMVVANEARLPELAGRFAAAASAADGQPRDYARFAMPDWRPAGGFTTEPALLLALARVESNFRPSAVSPAGARGPMQIMPRTAAYVTGKPSLAGRDRHLLHDPAVSLDVGQQYLSYLARHDSTGGSLVLTLAAYNAGPGSLARWLPSVNHRDDPLLFMEAIPNPETRAHVQRVLALAWIYASRLGRGSPSLDALASGHWPSYAAYEPGRQATARRPGADLAEMPPRARN